ncbi:uncharacterized protein LOC8285630 [Ricinus communis]|uniref:Protein unc-45 homolog B n=1 Tax=Ricinus communis TaxID=3988 RepID=B9SG45_RICCO|nr:uncharacterized protein LOC8285630 [Ricinus communis]EEF37461.1 heat shock protein 70 (HSP70)-interacting protein, putative [Ricinus communis]|eukprot:XP_002524964.1 uncharacterized protein LOC8285630 [Ricinus communis]
MELEHLENSLRCSSKMLNPTCTNPFCFFCTMNEPDPSLRRAKIAQSFQEMPLKDGQEHVLVLSGIWNIAMTQPDDPEFPSLGIFECMGKLIDRGIKDREWLLKDQNIYIPYYAAHIIGSYTMNKAEFADKAVNSGVVLPLMELLRGKITWVEQRVAIRALGHIASHERTFGAIIEHEAEMIELAMELACNCLKTVYKRFLGVKYSKRVKYHCDLLTRGLGGKERENKKAEEWAIQLRCWSLHLLNCFAYKERCLDLICKKQFLRDLCEMWGGLGKKTSPGGFGVLRTLCNSKTGRVSIANLEEVIVSLCNTSRSSHDCQHMAIDSLLSLLKDSDTRHKVIEIAALFLADLVEHNSLNERKKVIGEAITQALLQDYHKIKYGFIKLKSKRTEDALKEIWELKVERRKREEIVSEQELKEKTHLARLLKQEGNKKFWSGYIEKAVMKYTKALDLCPLRMRKERIVLYSNRAQGYLLLRNPDSAISDTTRALCLSSAGSPHSRSLWRRSQAYDMKGMAKESLMDCLMFINGRKKSKQSKNVKMIPSYAARMINKQVNATWLFADAKSKNKVEEKVDKSNGGEDAMMMDMKEKKGMPTILEESLAEREWSRSKQGREERRREAAAVTAELAYMKMG